MDGQTKTVVTGLVVLAVVFSIGALAYFWTGFVDTSGIETVWQQVAKGAAAAALAGLALVMLLGAGLMLLGALLSEVERFRLRVGEEYRRRSSEK